MDKEDEEPEVGGRIGHGGGAALVEAGSLKKSVKYCFCVLMELMASSMATNSFCSFVSSWEIFCCKLVMLVPMSVDCW